MSHTARQFFTIPVTIVANTCESTPVDMGFFSSMLLEIPPAWTTADLGLKVTTPINNLYLPLTNNSFTVRLTYVMPSRAYYFPVDDVPARLIKLYSCSETGDVNQVADRVVVITLKS